MNRKGSFAALLGVVGISIIFGMIVGGKLNAPPVMHAAAPAASAMAYSRGAPSIRIDTHRMDLTNRDTAARLYLRIQSSARKLCRDSISSSTSAPLRFYERCYKATVDDAVRSTRAPLLTALHENAQGTASLAQASR